MQTYLDWKHVNVSYIELVEMLFTLMENMAKHAFFASWNFTKFINCKRNLQQKEVIFVHDFAQNYLCVHQDEPQALHWEHQQVTIQPSVVFYQRKEHKCDKLIMHEIVHVSADLKHDAHLVKSFCETNMKVLNDFDIKCEKVFKFTDQAPRQYKNKCAFRYLSQSKIPVICNFLWSASW